MSWQVIRSGIWCPPPFLNPTLSGTPTHWRTATEDADRNPGFLDVWLNDYDAISPWMVGRLRDNEDVERFAEYTMKFDIELLRKRHEEGNRKVDYIPVVYPGFSVSAPAALHPAFLTNKTVDRV